MLLTRRTPRKGLSLLEVILALAVFLLSITGLVFLMGVASDQAIETEMRSQALSLCQSRLAEISSGAVPLEGKGEAACEDDNDYMWSMEVDSGGFGKSVGGEGAECCEALAGALGEALLPRRRAVGETAAKGRARTGVEAERGSVFRIVREQRLGDLGQRRLYPVLGRGEGPRRQSGRHGERTRARQQFAAIDHVLVSPMVNFLRWPCAAAPERQ